MVADLDVGVSVVAVPTVREADGLALSSRNRYLTDEQRATALLLSQALQTRDVTAGRALFSGSSADLDYLERVDSTTFEAAPDGDLLVIAAKVGTTRLIDNLPLLKEAP
jgi:pantoate--beta-alanine ligase